MFTATEKKCEQINFIKNERAVVMEMLCSFLWLIRAKGVFAVRILLHEFGREIRPREILWFESRRSIRVAWKLKYTLCYMLQIPYNKIRSVNKP